MKTQTKPFKRQQYIQKVVVEIGVRYYCMDCKQAWRYDLKRLNDDRCRHCRAEGIALL